MFVTKEDQNSVILNTDRGKFKLEPLADSIVHITYTLEPAFSSKESLMIVPQARDYASWHIEDSDKSISLVTERLKIVVDKATCAFSYFDAEGGLLVKEPDDDGKVLDVVNVMRSVFGDNAEIEIEQTVDGVRSRVKDVRQELDRVAYHSKLSFVWSENEAIYGLGSHEEGILDYRDHHQYLYQQNLKAVVPMFISTKGYGVLIDSYSLMTFRDDVYGSYVWTDIDDEMDYYFIYGPEADQIIEGYRKLTGKATMLPKWAYGYIQSKERYKSQDELILVAEEYRRRNVPLDCVVLDWMSWPDGLWGQKSFDPARFPDPKAMMERLHQLNVHLMVSIWPSMRGDGSNYREMKEKGYLLGNGATYNAFDEGARRLYWEQAYEGIFSHGIDAWWCDCTEPFEADWNGKVKPEPEQRLFINTEEMKKYLDPEYINAYSLEHSKGIYEGQRGVTAEKRVLNLTRSAYAGQQRYGTVTWSGDISARWDTLRKQIADGLNFCAAGMPYWTLDIGAFFVKNGEQWFWNGGYEKGCDDMGYRELYARWFQYGAFLPMFRSHGTDTPREVWRFGQPGEIFYDTLVKFINLRYRLLPYIYSLAGKVTLEDYTIMRPLAFDFRHDGQVYDIKDQYMFGPAFLVNPVTKPMYYERDSKELTGIEKSRRVYLPEGCMWYDFWTGQKLCGGQLIESAAPIDIMPLYVKAGSIVPMGPLTQYATEANSPIELRVYTGSDGEFDIYQDEGDNYNYEKGEYSIIPIKWDDSRKELSIGNRRGTYKGMPEEIEFDVVLVEVGRGISVEKSDKPDKTMIYDGDAVTMRF
ncbi:TIM-barrel domain-containing protein [Mahella australiensis]|uniref:Glycoside hydrolase family 31 n=1 Tax=Mahella australiensis (strain DSM 15567 / CIP 107919 / 50-1 BON) TaxID=697281 RepID=F3ZY47_MAHA5|nr:TIM-barrel domain-containing protein [Mahella australiensis]AEE97743.1 glycoside hydrolase family 31 [Mahella australiensis 50-1 BON]